MVLTIVEYCLYGLCTLPNCCCQGQGICLKKGNLSILSKRIVEGSEKNRVGVCGPLHIPPKGNVILYDQKAKKIKIGMILLVRVHSIACWDDGHMTNY